MTNTKLLLDLKELKKPAQAKAKAEGRSLSNWIRMLIAKEVENVQKV